MINEEYITMELELIEHDDDSIDKEIQEAYGLSYKEYVSFRNDLLRKHNYHLSIDVLSGELIKKAIIDLVANGFISPDLICLDSELSFSVTSKGYEAVLKGLESGHVKSEMKTWEALYSLRNSKQLK
jgi:hypothetical protein